MPFEDLDQVVLEVEPLATLFVQSGFRLFLVGGIVRDLWLDREITGDVDLDLTTDATPTQVKRIIGPIAEALWLQGERFGTIGARVSGRAYEVTTHRSEIYAEQSRKPDVAFSTAVDVDLSRRDFTVNAMAVEVPSGRLFDPFDGVADLTVAMLRTPLDPEVSFADDPLRMLRAARFVSGYGLTPAPGLVTAMSVLRQRLDIVSAERIREELDKLLVTANPGMGLSLLAGTGLLERFLPEVDGIDLSERGRALSHLQSDATVRLAALLYGVDLDQVAARLGTLRHSSRRRRATASVLEAVQGLVRGDVRDPQSLRRWVGAAGRHRDSARSVASAVVPEAQDRVELSRTLEAELGAELEDLSPALTGDEVMALLGLDQGPEIGAALDFVQELRFDEGPLPAEAAAERLVAWWTSRDTPR